MKDALVEAFSGMDEEQVLSLAQAMLEKGDSPMDVIEGCREAMERIGRRFEEGKAFVPELILTGEMMKAVTELVKPKLARENVREKRGTVLLGTVEGDIHDIGKDVVVFMLEVNGFEVVDLGVDVAPEAFVEKIKEIKPAVVGMSGLLTLAFNSMKQTVDAITEAGLRDQVKIMIGGAPVDEHVRKFSGADAWGKDAMQAVSLAQKWIGG
ncbi:MAG: cobalamin-dependent protein [Anaerolineales bacterium]|nr:cobalamin-dependent protein [Anaerolineales bacterium]